jgi:hypothetical protein
MDNKQNREDEQATLSPESIEKEELKIREISEEELKQILEDHKKWLDSDKVKGTSADLSEVFLSGADLSGANLNGVNLSKAILRGVDLSGADLSGADLGGADLGGPGFFKTDLKGVDFSEVVVPTGAKPKKAKSLSVELFLPLRNGADLREANLSGAKLFDAKLSGADLSKADLSDADLSGAVLSGADLSKAVLSRAILSGAIVDELTLRLTKKVKGGQVGVNGIWTEKTDTAALMTLTPPGNSMKGPNSEAVIESLKRARRLHGYSLLLAGIVLLIAILNLSKIQFPWTKDVEITPDRFGLLAMPISIGLLILVNSFMSDGLRGTRYLHDRESAMFVGSFPWALSRYAGESLINKILSFISRLVMSFHPIVFVYFLNKWKVINLLGLQNNVSISIFIILSFVALILTGWTFIISQRFQRPILFDSRTKEERKENIDKYTKVIKEQTSVMKELVDIIKYKKEENSKTPNSGENSSDSPENK